MDRKNTFKKTTLQRQLMHVYCNCYERARNMLLLCNLLYNNRFALFYYYTFMLW